ncbi:hypothetical protein V2I64_17105 [Pseudomonas viridiflava]|nr:hypothetical protein [Pseudomonas viridiflava]
MARTKYTVEKVLYFANQKSALHVGPNEEKIDSDLHRTVQALVEKGDIHLCGTDDSGEYFKTTKSGEIHLLKLQIAWRKAHQKDVADHQAALTSLTA